MFCVAYFFRWHVCITYKRSSISRKSRRICLSVFQSCFSSNVVQFIRPQMRIPIMQFCQWNGRDRWIKASVLSCACCIVGVLNWKFRKQLVKCQEFALGVRKSGKRRGKPYWEVKGNYFLLLFYLCSCESTRKSTYIRSNANEHLQKVSNINIFTCILKKIIKWKGLTRNEYSGWMTKLYMSIPCLNPE